MNPRDSDTTKPVVGFTPWPIYPCGISRCVRRRVQAGTVKEGEMSAPTGNRTLICPSPNISITVTQMTQLITSFTISIATGNAGLKKYIYSLCARFCNIPFIVSSISLVDFFFSFLFFLWPIL
jgi:hypothetical protein